MNAIAENTYVVGVDGGGTATRAVVLTLDGRRVGCGHSGGANPNSHPPEDAAGHLAEALHGALDGIDPVAVTGGVIGLAGRTKLSDPRIAGLFEAAWRSAGLLCPMRVFSDCEIAFAAATAEPDGTALVAGTGSIAARIVGRRMVARAGGYGWLLGDEGSAYWLGREAVRATLDALGLRRPAGPLAISVLSAADIHTEPEGEPEVAFAKLITAANGQPPIRLARFAPLIGIAAGEGDPDALRILDHATAVLVDLAMAARKPGERTPLVLIGGVVADGGPLTDRLRAALGERTGGEVLLASEAAAGAAWLAGIEIRAEVPHPMA